MSDGEKVRHTKGSAAFARAERRARACDLYLQGKPQAVIAKELGVGVNTVAKDLKEVAKVWQQRSVMALDERKAEELARIDRVEAKAWEGWLRSIERQEVHHTRKESVRQAVRRDKKVVGHKMQTVKVVDEVVVKGQSGDPRFLEQITACIQMRLRILGMWKGDVTTNNIVNVDWAELFRQQEDKAQQEAARRTGQVVLTVQPGAPPKALPLTPPAPAEYKEPAEADPVEARILEAGGGGDA